VRDEKGKKRWQRERAKRGSRVLPIEIMNVSAWCDILRDEGFLTVTHNHDRAIRAATEAFIWDMCWDYRREKAEEQLAKISPVTRTGLIDRETGPYQECRLIKAKNARPTQPDKLDPEAYFDLLAKQLDERDNLDRLEVKGTVAEGGFQRRLKNVPLGTSSFSVKTADLRHF
jgi:hypothetical protein